MMQVVIWENIFCCHEERQSQNSKTQVIVKHVLKNYLAKSGAAKLLSVRPGGFIVIVTLFLKVCGVGNKNKLIL
jgi:hypothetical protein